MAVIAAVVLSTGGPDDSGSDDAEVASIEQGSDDPDESDASIAPEGSEGGFDDTTPDVGEGDAPDGEEDAGSQPPRREFNETYLVHEFEAGTFIDGAVNEYGQPAGGEFETPNFLSLSYPMRWDDGTRVMLEVPRQLAEGNATAEQLSRGQLLLYGSEGFVVGVSIRACPQETLEQGSLNSTGLVVQRLSETTVRACRPEHRLELTFERAAGLTAAHIAVLDVGLLELGAVRGADYLEIDERDAPAVPGRYRSKGPLQVDDRRDVSTSVRADGYVGGWVWAVDDRGESLWEVDTNADAAFLLGGWAPPDVSDDALVIVTERFGRVAAYSTATGEVAWAMELDEWEAVGSLTISKETGIGFLTTNYSVTQAARAPRLRAIDLSSGALQWETQGSIEAAWQWDAPQRLDGKLLLMDASATSRNAVLWAFDEATGAVEWRRDLGSRGTQRGSDLIVTRSSATAGADVLVVLTLGIAGEVLRVDPIDGAIIWRAPATGTALRSGQNDTVLVGTVLDPVTRRIVNPTELSLVDGSQLGESAESWSEHRQECIEAWGEHVDGERITVTREPSAFLVASTGKSWQFNGAGGDQSCVVTAMHNRFGSGSCEQWVFAGELIRAASFVECLEAARLGDAVLHAADGLAIRDWSDVPAVRSTTQLNGWWNWSQPIIVDTTQVWSCTQRPGLLCAGPAGHPTAEGATWITEVSPDDQTVAIYGIVDGVVITGSRRGFIMGVDLLSGEVRWTNDEPISLVQNVFDDPARNQVIVFLNHGMTLGIDPQSGMTRWRSEVLGGTWDATSPVVFDDLVIAQARAQEAGPGSSLVAVSLDTGAEVWRVDTAPGWESLVAGRLVAEPGRNLLLVTGNRNDPRFARVDPTTGATVWSTNAGYELLGIDADHVVVADPTGVVHRLSITTGELNG